MAKVGLLFFSPNLGIFVYQTYLWVEKVSEVPKTFAFTVSIRTVKLDTGANWKL